MVAKRIGLHLFCVLCFTFMAVPSMARYIVVGNLTYTVTDEDQHTVSLNKWNNPKGDVVIPAKVMNEDVEYSVTSIEASVFYNCFSLESVEIPNSVTSIGKSAFYGCTRLFLIVPSSVTAIGNYAFESVPVVYYSGSATGSPWGAICLKTYKPYIDGDFIYDDEAKTILAGYTGSDSVVVIPDHVKTIEQNAFHRNIMLTSVKIPNSVTSIGKSAFRGCIHLFPLEVPSSVTNIGEKAFSDVPFVCYTGSASGFPWGANDAILNPYIDGDFMYEDETKSILVRYSGSDSIVIISDHVKTIRKNAFYENTNITSVVIPESVTEIGTSAFYNCSSLTSVEIPNSVKSIGDSAFYNCSNLSPLDVSSSVTTIGNYAFYNVPLVYYTGSALGYRWGAKEVTFKPYVDGDFIYADKAKTILGRYTGSDSVIVIPDYVKAIRENAFYENKSITSVVIPESVTEIGTSAFYKCSSLTSVEIPNSVKSIGQYAFYNCSNLSPLEVPSSVTTIGYYAFTNVPLVYYTGSATGSPWDAWVFVTFKPYIDGDFIYESDEKTILVRYSGSDSVVVIPDHVKTIREKAFYKNTNITSVAIPESVTSIGTSAFAGCSNLSPLEVPSSVTTIGYYAFANVPLVYYTGSATGSPWGTKKVTYKPYVDGDFIYADEAKTILGRYTGSDSVVVIPDHVKNIRERAFYENKSITSVVIPESVTEIGTSAFYNCSSLTSVEIPNSVKSIGDSAFYYCSKLSPLDVSSSVTTIGKYAFYNVPLVYYTGSATGSPWGAVRMTFKPYFDGDFKYADEAKTILAGYTGSNSVVVIPDHVKTIRKYAFNENKSITSVVIPESVTEIGDEAFYNCSSLISVEIPNSVTKIGDEAFDNCSSLISVEIPNSVTEIGESAFSGCNKLSHVVVPTSVTSIGTYAFYAVKLICYSGSATGSPWGAVRFCQCIDGGFAYENEAKTILTGYIGNDSVVVIPDYVKTIREDAFYGNKRITSVVIPESVTSIGTSAFEGCSNLSPLDVSSSVTTIGKNAFYNVPLVYYTGSATGSPWGAKKVTFKPYVDGDFIYFDEAKTILAGYTGSDSVIVIPDYVKAIREKAFYGNTNITSVEIPNSVTSIGQYAFYNCSNLSPLEVPSSVTTIGYYAFTNVPLVYYTGSATGSPWGAKEVTFRLYFDGDFIYSDKAKTILTGYIGSDSVVVIPDHVKEIKDSIFSENKQSVIVPYSVSQIGSKAFVGVDSVSYCGVAANKPWGANSIVNYYRIIHNLEEFLAYRDSANSGVYFNVRLAADIDLSPVCGIINGVPVSWTPIEMCGIFDGGNHTISNLYINQPEKDYQGLFDGWGNGFIANLKVKNAYVKGKSNAAGIMVHGLCSNCHFEGVVIGENSSGVGITRGGMSINCSNYGLIVSSSSSVGVNSMEMYNCYNRGRIVGAGSAEGLGDYVYNSYNAGEVSAPKTVYVDRVKENVFVLQQMDSSAFLSGAVNDSLNKYVLQNPKVYSSELSDSIPLFSWVQGEDGFPRFEDVDLQPTQGYVVRYTGALEDMDVSFDGTIALPVCESSNYEYEFKDGFDGMNIVSDTVVVVSKVRNDMDLQRDPNDGFCLIHNGKELAIFRDLVNDGAVALNARLVNDIDLSEECKDSVWVPIGDDEMRFEITKAYQGVFDGAGHTIEHLYDINDDSHCRGRGFFGHVRNAIIKNLEIRHSRITGFGISPFAYNSSSTIFLNCGSEADLMGYSDYGAAAFSAYGDDCQVLNCYNIGEIKAEWNPAGMFGRWSSTAQNCYSSAIVRDSRDYYDYDREFTVRFCCLDVNVVHCFADTVLTPDSFVDLTRENPQVNKTSTEYIKSDAFLAELNAFVDSMNAAQSEFVLAHWVRDESDGYPKFSSAPSHTDNERQLSQPSDFFTYVADGTLFIRSSHAGRTVVFDMRGRAIVSVLYSDGVTAVDGLSKGVYVVEGAKVVVR